MMPFMTACRRVHLPGCILGICLLCFFGSSAQLPADDDPPEEEKVEREVEDFNFENVEDSLFGERRAKGVPVIRSHLEEILERKLKAARARWKLSDSQVEKLERVGKSSIGKLFEQVDQHRTRLKAARQGINNRNDDNPLNRETSEIRSKLRSGPFGDDSLFVKVLRQLLTTEQAAEYDRRFAIVTMPPTISRNNAGDLTRVGRINGFAFRLAWNHDGSQLALLDFLKKVELYSFPDAKLLRTMEEGSRPEDFEFGKSETQVAIGRAGTGAVIVNLEKGDEVSITQDANAYPLEFSPDGSMLVVGGYGTKAKLWSIPERKLIREFSLQGGQGGLTPVFSPDGTLLAIGNRNSTTHIFETATGRVLHVLPHNMSHQLKFNPKGDVLAVVYVDGNLILWDVKTGAMKKQVQAFANELYTVDWSLDGTLLATAGYHTPITLWNADDLSIVNELESTEWIFDVKFSRDGRRLVTAGYGLIRDTERFVDIWAVP